MEQPFKDVVMPSKKSVSVCELYHSCNNDNYRLYVNRDNFGDTECIAVSFVSCSITDDI